MLDMICVVLFPKTLPCAPLLSVVMTKLSRAHTKSISFKTSSSLRRIESGDEFDDINSVAFGIYELSPCEMRNLYFCLPTNHLL